MEIHTIGIDLAKTIFHLVGVNARGEVVVRKKCSRNQLLRFTSNLRVSLIGMEACGGSHFLGRALREQGHDVRLMPAQYVKPYVKTNKNDYIDAEALDHSERKIDARGKPTRAGQIAIFYKPGSALEMDIWILHFEVRIRLMECRRGFAGQQARLCQYKGAGRPCSLQSANSVIGPVARQKLNLD